MRKAATGLQAEGSSLKAACARAGEGNVAIWGTPPDSIDDAEDRDKWYELLTRLDIRQPPGGMVTSEEGALAEAAKLGYPVRQLTSVLGLRFSVHRCSKRVPARLGSCMHAWPSGQCLLLVWPSNTRLNRML